MKRAIYSIIGGIIIILLFILVFLKVFAKNDIRHASLPTQPPNAITLLQAYEIAVNFSNQSTGYPRIASIESNDIVPDEQTLTPGMDGKRRLWEAVIISTQSEVHLTIRDGIIVEKVEQPLTGLEPLNVIPLVDSTDILNIALKMHADFSPDTEERRGYNFRVEQELETYHPVIKIFGSYNRHMAFISLDVTDGSFIEAKRQTIGGGGLLYSKDGGITWEATNLKDVAIGSVEADPFQDSVVYAVASQDWRVVLYRSQDRGKTWHALSELPKEAGDLPLDMTVAGSSEAERIILVGLSSGIWASEDGVSWQLLSVFPGGIATRIVRVGLPEKCRVFVSSTKGEKAGLYTSLDLIIWEKISDAVYRFSESFDHQYVLAADDLGVAPYLLLSVDDWHEVELPKGVIRAAGDFKGKFNVYGVQDGKVGIVSSFSTPKVDWVLPVDAASLAASPDFVESGVLLVGVFRGGIYRSEDNGQSWSNVLADPGAMIGGTTVMAPLLFVSPDDVIISSRGLISWLDF